MVQPGLKSPLKTCVLSVNHCITDLRLNEVHLEIGMLRKILTATPRLRHFDLELIRYSYPLPEHARSQLDFTALENELAACSATLESLRLRILYTSRIFWFDNAAEDADKFHWRHWRHYGTFPSLNSGGG